MSSAPIVAEFARPSELVDWIKTLPISAPMVILLSGPLGAGKTEWVRQLVNSIGGVSGQQDTEGRVGSPTYSLLNTYEASGTTIHHLDFYRLRGLDDLASTGFWDLFTEPCLICVEWPEAIPAVEWPFPQVRVNIEVLGNGARRRVSFQLQH